jgi:myosin heavy subunit
MIEHYAGKRRDEVPPHVFAMADGAYRAMIQDKKNQSMLVT